MEAATLIDLIPSLGFPIICVIALGWFMSKMWTDNNSRSAEREERMSKQIDRFGDSLDNFNLTLVKIDARLETVEKKVGRRADDKLELQG